MKTDMQFHSTSDAYKSTEVQLFGPINSSIPFQCQKIMCFQNAL